MEAHRQLERKGLGRQNPQAKNHEETWLRQQSREDSPEDLLQRLLSQQNASKQRSMDEIAQKRLKNTEKDLEMRVVPSAERNSKATLPNDEELGVALPQEREDNLSECGHELGAELSEPPEPDQSRKVTSPASHR